MAAPSYTTDLVTITPVENAGTWVELTGYTNGGTPIAENDYFIQGSYCESATATKTGLASIVYDNGSGVTVPSNGAILVWQYFGAPNSLDTYANGGLRILIGASLTAFNGWRVGGSDFPPNPYGGWKNVAVDPTVSSHYVYGGGNGGVYRYIGSGINLVNVVAKGYPHAVDAIRYGRCEARISGGDASGYATFSGFAQVNDNPSNRWGLIQSFAGGYLWKGLMTLGYGSPVNFVDSNTTVLVDNTTTVSSQFNKIEIRQSSSTVTWSNIVFQSLGTVSPGILSVVDDATVTISRCSFIGMSTFSFLSHSTVTDSMFIRCDVISGGGGVFTGTVIDSPNISANSSAFVWDVNVDTDGKLDKMEFVKNSSVAHHAITLGTSSPTSVTLRNVSFYNFNAANNQNDSTIYVARTSGTVTINAIGCTGNISYKSAGASVNVVIDPVTVSVYTKTSIGSVVGEVSVFLKAADNTGPLPFEENVTIVNSGNTAIVSHPSHGLSTGDMVLIKGASINANNGAFTITYINDNSYSYTMSTSPGANPTGTITSTFVLIDGVTDSNGVINMSRVFPSDQPVVGWARKSTTFPFYKSAPIVGVVDATKGGSFVAVMIEDY